MPGFAADTISSDWISLTESRMIQFEIDDTPCAYTGWQALEAVAPKAANATSAPHRVTVLITWNSSS